MTGTNDKLRSLFLAAIMVLSVFATTVAFAGTAAAANESVSISDQTTLGDSITVDSVDTGTTGTELAVWSTDDSGAPDTVLASKTLGTGYTNTFEPVSGLGISETQDVIVAVHSGTPGPGNIEAFDTARLTQVTADRTDSTPGDAPTYWQGQIVVLEPSGGQTWTPGQDYQIRRLVQNNNNIWEVDGGVPGEIRATGNGELIVRTENLPEEAYAVEADGNALSAGDTPGSASSLTGVPNYVWEIAIQNMDITPAASSVVNGGSVDVEVQSNRAGYDATAYWNGTAIDSFQNLGNFEVVNLSVSVTTDWEGNTEDLTFRANDTTASDTEQLTVTPPAVSTIVQSGAAIQTESEHVGDNATIQLDFDRQSTAANELRTWMLVGGPGDRILDLVNVTDVNDDGEATLVVNSFVLGRGAANFNAGYRALGNDTVNVTRPRYDASIQVGPSGNEQVWGGSNDPPDFQTPPVTGIASPLAPSSYELTTMDTPLINLSQDETELEYPAFSDADALTLQERSTDENISVHVAPRGTSAAFLNSPLDFQQNATRIDNTGTVNEGVVASGDIVIFQINAEGLQGYVNDAGDLLGYSITGAQLGHNGIHTWVNQVETPASGDRYYWDLAQHATLIKDGENDTYYVRVDTDRLDGVGSRTGEAPPNTEYEMNMVIAGGQNSGSFETFANFWEEGDFPDDNNFQFTTSTSPVDQFDLAWSPYLPDAGDGQEFATGEMALATRMAQFDQFVQNVGELRVNADSNVTMSGTTNLAPGSTLRVSLRNTSAALTVDQTVTVTTAGGERVFSADGINLSGQEGTEFLTWALERGTSITNPAQATVSTTKGEAIPSLVGAVPNASVTMDDQQARDAGTLVTVHDVQMNKPGFVAIHSGSAGGPVIGVSAYLEAGSHSNVNVRLQDALDSTTTLVAMPHLDTNDNRVYDFSADPSEDTPFTADGAPVTDDASVMIPTPTTTTTTTQPPTTTTTQPPTTTTTAPPTTTTTEPPTTTTTTESGGPGFGVIVALVALIAAALLAVRRQD